MDGKGGNISQSSGLFLTAECYEKLVTNLDILDIPCLQLLLSKLVGYSIIAFTSIFVKLPQIIKILRNHSAEGISFTSILLMLITSSSTVAYSIAKSYPLSVWGESIAFAVQNLFICCLILNYDNKPKQLVVCCAVYVCAIAIVMSPMTPMLVHVLLQMTTFPMVATSKGLQIWTNYSNGSTGQLSAISIFAMNFRSMGRLYTYITETGDPLQTAVFGMSSILNIILSGQILYYKDSNIKTA